MFDDYIIISDNKIPTLLALTSSEQEKGLMFRETLPPAMSFVYKTPKINKFWMSNTYLPLDIVFSLNGKITNICKGEPLSTSLIGSDSLSDLIIEFPYGTCSRLEIKSGDSVKLICSLKSLAKLNSI